ncbi:MAG: bifunctional diaminohydroxyphosphoribosylaminopyrimidine deaminase/5-amino-6-(5-phosphoribosylamino)uracil reductase RibD [Spirosomataceae bacterium]
MFSVEDHRFMRRALDLALLGAGAVSPNPLVGCVLVVDGCIIGEGYHQQYGQAHAEVNAVASVSDPLLLKKATAYVTLEPCAHVGKTPPCADLLIRVGVPRVVISNEDPFPQVAGRGIQKLREAGCQVEVGCLSDEGKWINRRFFHALQTNRPFVILKWAQSRDGFVGTTDRRPLAITGRLSQKLTHQWRGQEDAILIGSQTALQDNPSLTTRAWPGRNPQRIVLDPSGRIPTDHPLMDGETWVYTEWNQPGKIQVRHTHFLEDVLQDAFRRNIRSILVEGGPTIQRAFQEAGWVDEYRIGINQRVLGHGWPALSVPSHAECIETRTWGDDTWRIFRTHSNLSLVD